MNKLRMRTTLLIPLLLLSVGGTVVSLLVIRTIVQQQVRIILSSDLRRSVKTYQNIQRQRRELLFRESALLADLPSLKALMTTRDIATIEDAGAEFWQVSGSDFFALLDANGKLVAVYNRGPSLKHGVVERGLEIRLPRPEEPLLLPIGGHLYEISTQPLFFGARAEGSRLGFVAVGYAVDEQVAREVSEAAAAEVTFAVDGQVVASTLNVTLQQQLMGQLNDLSQFAAQNKNIRLGNEDYLVASVPLTKIDAQGDGQPQLIVLKSFDQATRFLRKVNQWVLTLGLFALVASSGMLVAISHTLTRPIDTLVKSTRALADGNFDYQMNESGVAEIRELSRAFERMRVELQRSQIELLDSERLATIGRMASSISHDLRHYLSAMYANAEFMSDGGIAQSERDELFLEVRSAVQGMTDLLDSLLLFTQTGRTIYPEYESIALLIQRSVGMVRSHPGARDVKITVTGLSSLDAWVDAKKLGRAIYNLLLNACQSARLGGGYATVVLSLQEDEDSILIRIADNGPGVPESIRQTLFLPFVSEGKASGIGLGLTLAQQIAQEHGGSVIFKGRADGYTIFEITLPKAALRALGDAVAKKGIRSRAPAHQ